MHAVEREIGMLRMLLEMYCAGRHGTAGGLYPDCAELFEYAGGRVARCPHLPRKPSCRSCTIHCFDAAHRERIRAAMRYAGPRLFLRHPWRALEHLLGR